jgi:hypothetical protein
MTPEATLRVCVMVAGATVMLSSAQTLVTLGHYGPGGPFDTAINPISYRFSRLFVRWGLSLSRHTARFVGIVVIFRMLMAVVLCLPDLPTGALAVAAMAAVTSGALLARVTSSRTEWGEQILKVVLGGAALAWIGGSEDAAAWGVWFIAAQVALAYSTGGALKLAWPAWRSGEALWTILSLESFGHPPVGAWLRRHGYVCQFLSWVTVAWELTFPLVFILPPPAAVFLLLLGVGFHGACAFAMGLNTYIFSFVATYPAVLYVNLALRAWWA